MPDPPSKPSILFCGKHRVNFAMFDPVYQRLRRNPEIELAVSSGRYRRKPVLGWLNPRDPDLLNERLFAEFDIDPSHLIKTSCRDKRAYDVYVTSNLDTKMQPPNSKVSVQIYHGVSFRNLAVNPEYARFTKLFFPGRYMAEQYIKYGILKEGDLRIEIIGLPKLDRLVNGTIRREEVIRRLGLSSDLPTVLWCPAGARGNSFERLGLDGLRALQDTGYNVILKLHDHPHLPKAISLESIQDLAKEALGPRGRLATHSDVTPLLAAADLLISDASSVAYEYCVLDRPIVFVDVPELLEARAKTDGSKMDTETHGRKMGRIVDNAAELVVAVRDGLADPKTHSPERRACAGHLFHKPGTATERVARRLCELARASYVSR